MIRAVVSLLLVAVGALPALVDACVLVPLCGALVVVGALLLGRLARHDDRRST